MTAIFVTIGPANFFTLMAFISTSVIRRMRHCSCDASTASRWPDASFAPDPQASDRAKQDINKQEASGPIVMKTAGKYDGESALVVPSVFASSFDGQSFWAETPDIIFGKTTLG